MGVTSSSFENEIQNVKNVQGLPANSASPTDTWIVTYQKSGEPETKLFWKMFLTSTELNSSNNITALKYEINVYKDVVKPLLINDVCPFFVKYLYHFNDITDEQLIKLTNDNVGLSINKKHLLCHSIDNKGVKTRLFSSPYVESQNLICSQRGKIKRLNVDANYYYWMKYYKIPFIDTFDCFQLTATNPNLTKPMLDNKGELTLALTEELRKLNSVQMYRFFNKLSKDYRSNFSNPLVEKIVRRDTDNQYFVDDLYLTSTEKESLKSIIPPTVSFASKDDLIWYAKNNNIKLPNFVTNADVQRVRAEDAAVFFNNQKNTMDSCRYSILITEATKPNTMTFKEYIDNVFSTNIVYHIQDFMTIYFQLCIACYALSLTKTNHNDLHTGNVFVTRLAKPDVIDMYVNDKKYSFVTSYIVTLYDFDRAFVQRFGKNPMLDFTCFAGQCNRFNEKLDIFKVSCYFSKVANRATQNFLMTNIYPLLGAKEIYTQWLQRMYISFDNCFFKQDDLSLEERLFSYPQIIENVFSKISKPSTSLPPTKHVFYLHSRCFNPDGTLDVAQQQNAIERLTGRKPAVVPVPVPVPITKPAEIPLPVPIRRPAEVRPAEVPLPVSFRRADEPMEIGSDGFKSRKQKKKSPRSNKKKNKKSVKTKKSRK